MIETKFSHVISQFPVSRFYLFIYRSHFHFLPGFTQPQLYGENLSPTLRTYVKTISYHVLFISGYSGNHYNLLFPMRSGSLSMLSAYSTSAFYKFSTNKRLGITRSSCHAGAYYTRDIT